MSFDHNEKRKGETACVRPTAKNHNRGPTVGRLNYTNSGESDTMSTMSSEDTERYNGYANRETWAFNLHWQNDQGMYLQTLEVAGQYMNRQTPPDDYSLGEIVVGYWRDEIDAFDDQMVPPAQYRMFDREVGSWWRIDYREVGEAVRESLDAES